MNSQDFNLVTVNNDKLKHTHSELVGKVKKGEKITQ